MNINIISRGKGKNAVAAAAYRAGKTIKNEYDGQVHDYSKKKGIVHTEMLLPEYAPDEMADRATRALESQYRNHGTVQPNVNRYEICIVTIALFIKNLQFTSQKYSAESSQIVSFNNVRFAFYQFVNAV